MSSKSESGYVLVKEKYPYNGKGVEELLGALKKILSAPDNRYAQKVILQVGAPHIYIEKLLPEAQAQASPKLSILELVRAQKMEEYIPQVDNLPALAQLWEMFRVLRMENLEISHILIGSKDNLQKWLGIRIPFNDLSLFGIPLHIVDVPEDVIIVCGSSERISDPEDIIFSLKGTMP